VELENEFILLEPFKGMPQISHLIKSIVTATPEEREALLKKDTYMGKSINKYIELEGVAYPTTFWQIFCAYGLIDCVNKTATYMKGKKELPTIDRRNDVPIEYDALFLATKYQEREVVKILFTIHKVTAETATLLLAVTAQNNDWGIAKLLLAVPGVDLTKSQGSTLAWAIEHRNLKFSKALLMAGANPTGLPYRKNFEKNPSVIALFLIFDQHPVDRSVIDIDISLAKCVLKAVQYTKGVHENSRFISATDKQVYKIAQNLLSEILDDLGNPEAQFHMIMAHLRKISKGVLGGYELTLFDVHLLLLIYELDNLWQQLKINKPSNADTKAPGPDHKKIPGLVLDTLLKHNVPQAVTTVSHVQEHMVEVPKPIEITILEPFSHSENTIKLCKILLSTTQEKLLRLLDTEKFIVLIGKALQGQDGITALHIFCAYGLTACAHRMLELGDNLNAVMFTSDYYTPLDLAKLYNHPETITMLQKHGAKNFDPQFYQIEDDSHSSSDSDELYIERYYC